MYYLAFFIDYHPFFQKKIKSWLFNKKNYNCFVVNETQNSNFISINYLLECPEENLLYYYNEPWYRRYGQLWYIYGQKKRDIDSVLDCSNLLLEKPIISLEKIDALLDCFAEKYQWSIMPWCNEIRFRSFVFISKEPKLRDRFVKCSSNITKIPFLSNQKYNMLISQYNVNNHFSEIAKAIVFQENIKTTGQIWDACECYIYPPWLVTSIDFQQSPILKNYLDLEKKIKNLIKSNISPPWQVYQVDNKISFELISKELILKSQNVDGTAFWIPQTTDIYELQSIILKTEPQDINYSDLSYLQDFLAVCEWLYGFGRNVTAPDSLNCSLFISRDSTIIQEVDIFRQEEKSIFPYHNYHYDLLASF